MNGQTVNGKVDQFDAKYYDKNNPSGETGGNPVRARRRETQEDNLSLSIVVQKMCGIAADRDYGSVRCMSDRKPQSGKGHWSRFEKAWLHACQVEISGQDNIKLLLIIGLRAPAYEGRKRSCISRLCLGYSENKNKGDREDEDEMQEKSIVIHPLYGAYCGYGTWYSGL